MKMPKQIYNRINVWVRFDLARNVNFALYVDWPGEIYNFQEF